MFIIYKSMQISVLVVHFIVFTFCSPDPHFRWPALEPQTSTMLSQVMYDQNQRYYGINAPNEARLDIDYDFLTTRHIPITILRRIKQTGFTVTSTNPYFWDKFREGHHEWPRLQLAESTLIQTTTSKKPSKTKSWVTHFPKFVRPSDHNSNLFTNLPSTWTETMEPKPWLVHFPRNLRPSNITISSFISNLEGLFAKHVYANHSRLNYGHQTPTLTHFYHPRDRPPPTRYEYSKARLNFPVSYPGRLVTLPEETDPKGYIGWPGDGKGRYYLGRGREINYDLRTATSATRMRGEETTKCYFCGLNVSTIPISPGCFDTFDSPDNQYRPRMRSYKAVCTYANTTGSNVATNGTWSGPTYKDGCFKRFLDIGYVYDERGCRAMPPVKGKSFASKRFAKLELVLRNKEEGCVTSPHASLTPFARGISLFARYHVCVCKGKYCNNANSFELNLFWCSVVYIIFLRI